MSKAIGFRKKNAPVFLSLPARNEWGESRKEGHSQPNALLSPALSSFFEEERGKTRSDSRSNTSVSEQRLTRRQFLRQAMIFAGGSATLSIVPSSVLGADGSVPPSERITAGLIGRGLMGRGHLRVLLGRKETHVLAVCDVDRGRCEEGQRLTDETYAAERASGTYRGCAACNDYREVLDRPDIDAVVIATPDHWHSLMSCDAAAAGKDIYCEKPVSLNIRESRRLVEAVRRNGCVFQTGTQYRSIPTIREVCEFVRLGGLGRVKQVFTLWGKTQVPKLGPSYVPLDPVLPAEPLPDGLDWNLWVGPATWRPYNAAYHRNPPPGVVPWVFCDAFGAGAVTGYQSHAADVIQYALGVETSGPVEILHPSGGEFPTLTFRYANGTLLHHVDHWGQVKDLYHAVPATARLAGNFGGVFVGERGWVTSMSTGGPIEAGPVSLLHEMQLGTREVNIGANNHHANWFECLRSRARPSSHEEIGHRSAALGHLATISYTLERSLKWNPATEEFQNDEQANRLRSRALREPWRV
ncbi:MAG: Gfo/Idh/MocA family oxidoreductase [Verrucomicrobia bacterium]|nr:Gfo/Idh/MocA family oxidoreductase [Verrucomicrobiota bacterium]